MSEVRGKLADPPLGWFLEVSDKDVAFRMHIEVLLHEFIELDRYTDLRGDTLETDVSMQHVACTMTRNGMMFIQ